MSHFLVFLVESLWVSVFLLLLDLTPLSPSPSPFYRQEHTLHGLDDYLKDLLVCCCWYRLNVTNTFSLSLPLLTVIGNAVIATELLRFLMYVSRYYSCKQYLVGLYRMKGKWNPFDTCWVFTWSPLLYLSSFFLVLFLVLLFLSFFSSSFSSTLHALTVCNVMMWSLVLLT